MSVIDYLNRLVNQVTQAVSLALSIVTTLITSGWYIVVRDAATVTGDIHGLLEDPTCGQEAQCTKLDTIITTADDIVTLLNDLSTLVGGGRVVNLPTTPPAGYGGGASVADVWTYVPSGQAYSTQSLITMIGGFFPKLQVLGGYFPVGDWPFIAWAGPLDEPDTGAPNFNNIPYLDWSTITAADASCLAWLERVYPAVGWYDAGGGMVQAASNDGDNVAQVTIDPAQFAVLKLLATNGNLGGRVDVAPVWPGLANVTYGDTQSMDAPNGSLSGPADGYHIVIDATPSWAGKFDFGTVQSWRNVGAISFVSDEGVPEPAQTLGFANVIYTPQRMAHSVGAYYRIATGYHANATPFTINST